MITETPVIDKIILGDNQFWGVNHLSQDKGKETEKKFRSIEEIRSLLHTALDNGVSGVMFSTHPMIYSITDMMRADARLKESMHIYVNVPYIVKYVRMASEMGMLKSVQTVFGGQGILGSAAFLASSAYGALTNDYLSLTNRLIDIEMNPFHDLKVKAIFLHNALTDLAIGYGMSDVLRSFYDYVGNTYHAIPAFGTLNFPALDELLAQANIGPTVIMTAVNKNGFLMNPSRQACEKSIATSKNVVLAMATLASGSLKPEEAYAYLGSLSRVDHVVVGVSTKEHAEQSFSTVRKYLV
jgi:hypothetical protein